MSADADRRAGIFEMGRRRAQDAPPLSEELKARIAVLLAPRPGGETAV